MVCVVLSHLSWHAAQQQLVQCVGLHLMLLVVAEYVVNLPCAAGDAETLEISLLLSPYEALSFSAITEDSI